MRSIIASAAHFNTSNMATLKKQYVVGIVGGDLLDSVIFTKKFTHAEISDNFSEEIESGDDVLVVYELKPVQFFQRQIVEVL